MTKPSGSWPLIIDLSLRDLVHEKTLALCSVIGLAAVLAPLIILFGLKHGIIEGLRADLIDNPRSRMVVNAANRNFDEAFLARLAARPDIAFVIPRIRSLNTEARFENPARPGSVLRAELLATGPGDPLLVNQSPVTEDRVIVSASFAARLNLAPGMVLNLRALRGNASAREVLNFPVIVAGIAPASAFGRDGVFVDLRLLLLVDRFTDGALHAQATLRDITPDPARIYAGFRAHTRRLEDVIRVDHDLRRDGIEVETQSEQVESLLGLDRSLSLLFALIAGLGGLGYLISLGVGLFANIERKRRDLSLLRLIGLSRRALVAFPLLQSLVIGLSGALLASAVAIAVAGFVNRLPLASATGAATRSVCVIEEIHILLALAVTLFGAALSAIFAGVRAGRILPAEGLRDA